MKKLFLLLIIIIAMLSFILTGCNPPEEKPDVHETGIGFNFSFSAVFSQRVKESKAARAINNTVGTLTITNTDTGEISDINFQISIDEDTYTAVSHKTIILNPGEYNFSFIVVDGSHRYAGSSSNITIIDGHQIVPLTLSPVIGGINTDIDLTQITSFRFRYPAIELNSLGAPALGYSLNSGDETVLSINKATGLSEAYVDLEEGEYNFKLKLYDGNIQVGKSVDAQENVVVETGNDMQMDIVPLYGETDFNFSIEQGEVKITTAIPREIIEEAGGVESLQVILNIVSPLNGDREVELSLLSTSENSYNGEVILTQYTYDTISYSLRFIDRDDGEIIGSCATQDILLQSPEQSFTLAMQIRRRAVIGGNLLSVLGINVFNTDNIPQSGVRVYVNGELKGITGSGGFGAAGYLKLYLVTGKYVIRAEKENFYNEANETLSPLEVKYIDIIITDKHEPPFPVGNGVAMGKVGTLNHHEDGSNFSAISGAAVTIAGQRAGTNDDGTFTVTDLPGGEYLMSVSKEGYFNNYKMVTLLDNDTINLGGVFLLPKEHHTISAAGGGIVSSANGLGSVNFAANSFRTASGAPYLGEVNVYINAIIPQEHGFFESFPGGFTGITTSGEKVDIGSYGVITVEIYDINGTVLKLEAGKPAEISIKVNDPSTASNSIPLWYFDEDSGEWIEEGEAQLTGDEYVGTVSHFTPWNYDKILMFGDNYQISGFVFNSSGAPVANALVIAASTSYFGIIRTTISDSSGYYSLPAFRLTNGSNPIYSVYAIRREKKSNTELVSLGKADVGGVTLILVDPETSMIVRNDRGDQLLNNGSSIRMGTGTNERWIRITSQHSLPITVNSIDLTGSRYFTMVSDPTFPFPVNEDSTVYIRVRYRPAIGQQRAQLIIGSNCVYNQPSFIVNLEGGTDLTEPLTEVRTVKRLDTYIGVIQDSPDNPNYGIAISNISSAVVRVGYGGICPSAGYCFNVNQKAFCAFDLSFIPTSANITSAIIHTGISDNIIPVDLLESNHGPILKESDYIPVNGLSLLNGYLSESAPSVGFNETGLNTIRNNIGQILPVMFSVATNLGNEINLAIIQLEVTYTE